MSVRRPNHTYRRSVGFVLDCCQPGVPRRATQPQRIVICRSKERATPKCLLRRCLTFSSGDRRSLTPREDIALATAGYHQRHESRRLQLEIASKIATHGSNQRRVQSHGENVDDSAAAATHRSHKRVPPTRQLLWWLQGLLIPRSPTVDGENAAGARTHDHRITQLASCLSFNHNQLFQRAYPRFAV